MNIHHSAAPSSPVSGKTTVRDLPQLIDFLKGLPEEVFSHYVSPAHHNIADWIFEGYGNEKLSRKVRKIHHKKKMIKVLEKELKKQKKAILHQEVQRIKPPRRKHNILTELQNLDNHLNTLTVKHHGA